MAADMFAMGIGKEQFIEFSPKKLALVVIHWLFTFCNEFF